MRKSGLLAGCALGACLAALPGAAAAQGLQGIPTVASGTAGITTAPGYTLVVPTTAEVVIEWEPLNNVGLGTIDFLPAGMTAEFAEVTGTFDYTVLNRILPVDPAKNPVDRVVAFNGTVFSRVGNAPGGDIWFYSPTGIIAGPTAVFNVGSLILTTNDIPFVAGGSMYGPGGLVQLQGPAGSTGFVDVQAGAQITASAGPFGPAYVALVAPRVVQGGLVQANGTIGYIAAEQVDMTINGGLFDFVITMGTTDLQGIVHTGTTTGPASTSAADVQRISMVALPKNDAMTMMLAGSVGYTPAAVAANEGSSVVLAAGFASDDPTLVPANRLGIIDIDDTAFTNRLTAYATDAIDVIPGVTTSFAGPTTLYALNAIDLTATVSTSITAASTLTLRSGAPGIGGTIDINALGGGQITAAGGFALDATSGAADYDTVTPWVDANGGTVNVLADGGEVTTPLGFVINAAGLAGPDPGVGGQGSGGTIGLQLDNNGSIGAATMTLTALGRGGTSAGTGGLGTGGTIIVTEAGGQLDLGNLSLFAQGAGGNADVLAGDGSAGTVRIELLDQAQDWDALVMDASASAGLPTAAGGASGHASSSADAVLLTVAGSASLIVQAGAELSADARSGIEVAAGLGAQAGGVILEAIDGGSIDSGFLDLHADAYIRGDTPDVIPNISPIQQGGLVSVLADGGTIVTQSLGVSATATGHEAIAAAGTATGGTAQVMAITGGAITVDNGFGTATLTMVADGYGAAGPLAAPAAGGTARLVAQDGSIAVLGATELSASGALAEVPAATSGQGAAATGGTAGVELLAGALGTASIATSALAVRANGDARLFFGVPSPGGDPTQGHGGDGTGGTASVLLEAGMLTAGSLLLEAAGTGGASAALDSLSPLVSGDGTGGTARFVLGGGTANVTTLQLEALGRGGGGAPDAGMGQLAALAGNGTGGTANLQINGGSLTAVDAGLLALGTGGPGMGHTAAGAASNGGAGTGGTATLQSPAGGAGSFTSGSLSLLANGLGNTGGMAASGAHGDGGSGAGGNASADLSDGAFALGAVTIEATGTGGDSGAAGGRGSGGAARFALTDSAAGPSGLRTLAGLDIDASGFGGFGSVFVAPSDIGEADLTVAVLDPVSPLDVTGGLTVFAGGTDLTPAAGIEALISGAPLLVEGNILMSTAAPLTVTANQPLRSNGFITLSGSTVTTTGPIQAGSDMAVTGPLGIATGRLTAIGSLAVESDSGNILTGDLDAGTWSYVDAFGSATVGNVVAGTDAAVTTRGGSLTVGTVTAGDEIWLSVFGTDPASLLTAGNLVSTGLGNDAAEGPPELFGGPGPTGNVTRVFVPGSLALADVQTPGRAILVADSGTITVGTADATEALILLARGDVALGTATTAGRFYVADSSLFLPNLPTAYDPASLNGVTPVRTAGGLTVGSAVDAGDVTVAVAGNAQAPSWTSAGALLIDAGGQFASGAVAAAGNASVTADGGVDLASLNSGGTTLLRATGGAVAVDNLLSTGLVTAQGRSVDLASTGALAFADLDATAGALSVVTAGNLALSTADATAAVTLRSTAGAVNATGAINSGGALILAGNTGVTAGTVASGGTSLLQSANGTVSIGALTSPGAVTTQGRALDLHSPAGLAFANAQATAGNLLIDTQGNLALAQGAATGLLTLSSVAGAISATGPLAGGGNVSITAPLGVNLAGLTSGGTTLLRATNGAVNVTNLLSTGLVTAQGRSVDIASTGALTFADLDATAGALAVQTAGNLTVATADATGAVTLRSTGGALRATGTVNGASIALTATGGVQADANLAAAGALAVDAGGTFTLTGTGRGSSVSVTSSDIALGTGAALGARGQTTALTLINRNPANVTFVGGAAQPAGYSLDNAEVGRLFADTSITIGVALTGPAPPAGQATIEIGDLTLGYGAGRNLGTGGELEISTPARISITGDVALTTSGANDTFTIDPTLVELDSSTGSIALLDAGGTPLGGLQIVGDTFAAASTGALAQLRTLTDMAAINALLDTPGGVGLPLRAGTVTVTADDAFYVQNSGASPQFADRRGFAASGLDIVTASPATRIVINGQILTPAGAVSGLATVPLVRINGAAAAAGGQFDPASTINGCVIGSQCAPLEGGGLPTSSDIDSPIPPGEGPGSLFVAPLIELAGTEPLITPPLVDEPITGVGNDDLWEPRCDPEEDGAPCPESDSRP